MGRNFKWINAMEYTLTLHKRTSPFRIVLRIVGDGDADSFTWTEIEPNGDKPFFAAAQSSYGYFDNKAPDGAVKRAIFRASGLATDKRPPALELQICRLPNFKIRDFENCWQGNILTWRETPDYKGQSLKGFTWNAQPV